MIVKELLEILSDYDENTQVKLYDIDRKGAIEFHDLKEADIVEYAEGFLGIGGF